MKLSVIIPATAVAGGIASFANLIGTAHIEAGLRTMSLPKEFIMSLLGNFNVGNFFEDLKETSLWKKGSYEPYPEQFDTRVAASSAGVHFAPTRINSENLLDEGYASERVFVVGNPVSDVINLIEKQVEESNIFEKYPILAEGSVIRFCVHRRENITSYHRFMAIYESMTELIHEGRTVLFISLGATEKALESYKLKEKTLKLAKKYKNFIFSPVWSNYADVIATMKKCSAVVSGKIIDVINRITKKEYFFNLFKLMEHDRVGLSKMPFWRKGETIW